jgi:hypothetical protein
MIMKVKNDKTILTGRQACFSQQQKSKEAKNDLRGYPTYPVNEDIYSKYQKEKDINPEYISKTKGSIDNYETNNETDLNNDVYARDLDVPGAELDDNQENIGSEDEENNYYSLGGDDHNELEEDKGD